MHVAVYCDLRYQRRDGALHCEESFARFAAELAGHVERLTLAGRLDTAGATPFAHRLRADVGFAPLPDYPALSRPLPAARALAASLGRLSRLVGSADAVWLLGPHPLALAGAAMALARRRRLVLGVREDLVAYVGLRHPGRRARAAALALDGAWRALARVAPVVVVGSALARRYAGSRTVLPIAVSLAELDAPASAARRFDGPLEALSVGRLDAEKNPLLLADVLAGLPTRWSLRVCGTGTERAALERRVVALGVGSRATLMGAVGAAELAERYAGAHALLHVSWSEGVPQVLFEAWAAGLPVVATDVGGVGDVARGAALLIPPDDAAAALAALERLAGDAALRDRLADAGRARVARHAAPVECGRIAVLLRGGRADAVRPPHRHAWVWTVLAPDARRVAVHADADLGAALRLAGLEVVELAAPAPDALLIDAAAPAGRRAAREAAAAAAAGDGPLIAVALGGGPPEVRDGGSRARRALELLQRPAHGAAAAVRARRLETALRARGLAVATLATGERTRAHGLGPGAPRLPVGRIVVAAHGERPAGLAETARAAAAAALGAPLETTATTVTLSGKLVMDVRDPAARPYVLRVAAGPSRALLEASRARLAELAAAAPAPALRSRVPWPLAHGEVGAALWLLEPYAAGRHPRRMTARLWEECLDALVALHLCDRVAIGDPGLTAQARAIATHLEPDAGDALARVAGRVGERLADVPLGWAHGDVWPDNLLVRHGGLNVLLDWDWATARALPMLDLLDLIAATARGEHGLPPGPRLERLTWPLMRAGGDERTRAYAARTGAPDDRAALEAFAVASWLSHVARDLLAFADRQRPAWLEQNVGAPLAALERAGW